ncbi:hypothetical protein GZH53_03540 [Flavihumibacter sp. R14]|nr:hypothetical protein [Flavihumibacter soli]
MAKVTQQDVVNFLKEKVAQLTKDLESAQNALNALEGSAVTETPAKRGRKPKTEGPAAPKRRRAAKPGGAKRGRKPKIKVVETEVSPDQLGE